MIKFKCERCQAAIRVLDSLVGKNVTCPACQHKMVVPRKEVARPSGWLITAGVTVVVAVIVLVIFWPRKETPQTPPKPGTNSGSRPPRPGQEVNKEGRTHEDRLAEERARLEWEAEDRAKREREEIEREIRARRDADMRKRAEYERDMQLREEKKRKEEAEKRRRLLEEFEKERREREKLEKPPNTR